MTKSILFKTYTGKRMKPSIAKKRMMTIIEHELTPRQQEILFAYYYDNKNIPTLAKEMGVHKSTISRSLRRSESRIRQILQY